MTLNKADLCHIHKVLTSDTAECQILMKPERIAFYRKRIMDNKRVIARIECILGEHLVWS